MHICTKKLVVWCLAALLTLIFAVSAMAEGPKWIGAFNVKGKVGLKWQAFDGATEYRVYRKVGSGEFELILTTDKTQHFDTDLTPGENHVYKIAVLDASGNELFSDEKSVMIEGAAAGSFSPPVWVGVRTDRRGVLLNWDRMEGAIAYNVYRSTTAGGPYEVVGNTPSSKYSDRDVEQGLTYYYVLTAMNEEFEETAKSKEQHIKFGMTEEELSALDTTAVELEETKLTFLFAIDEAGSLGKMNMPTDVHVNSKGDIYVSDTRRFRIDCFDSNGKHKFSFGERTPRGEEENPPEGTFESPMPLFIDSQDRVYVGDNVNHDIQVFDADGSFLKRIRVDVADDQDAFRPNGLAVLDDGRILATDAGSHRLLYLDQNGKILNEVSHGGKTTAESEGLWFSFPAEVAVSKDNVVSVIDQMGARIQQFDTDGNFVRVFGGPGYNAGQFGRPKGITIDPEGRLWISDGMANTVQIFTGEGEVKSAITGFDEADLKLASPSGMFVRDGRFYIVTRLTNQVLVFQIG